MRSKRTNAMSSKLPKNIFISIWAQDQHLLARLSRTLAIDSQTGRGSISWGNRYYSVASRSGGDSRFSGIPLLCGVFNRYRNLESWFVPVELPASLTGTASGSLFRIRRYVAQEGGGDLARSVGRWGVRPQQVRHHQSPVSPRSSSVTTIIQCHHDHPVSPRSSSRSFQVLRGCEVPPWACAENRTD